MAEQTSRLVIEISAEHAKRNAQALSAELERLVKSGNAANDSSVQLTSSSKATAESMSKLESSAKSTTKALSDQSTQADKTGAAVTKLAKYALSYMAVDKAISMADGYTQMSARIKNATASTQEYNKVQDRLYETANTTFRSLAEAQEVYLAMAGGMKSLGYNTQQTLDMTDSLSFAFTANATRADQAQSAMDALSKSMAKGKVDADAWISIVTGADNIISDMAKTTGKTESEIRQLGATGKISLEELIKTLVSTRSANEALANNMENSFADGMQKLTNATTKFLGELNGTTKATGILASGLGVLGDHVEAVALIGGVAATIYGGRLAAAWALSAEKALWNATATVTMNGAMATATTTARALYTALGGPIGLIFTLGTAAASYLLFRDSTQQSTQALIENSKYAKQTAKDLLALEGAQKEGAKADLANTYKDLSKELLRLNNQYNAQVIAIQNSNKASWQVADISNKVRQGIISKAEALKQLNLIKTVTPDQINKLTDLCNEYTKTSSTLSDVKGRLDTVKTGMDQTAKATDQAATAQERYNKSLDALKSNAAKTILEQEYIAKNIKIAGGTKSALDITTARLEWRKANDLGDLTKPLTTEQEALFYKQFQALKDTKALIDSINDSKKVSYEYSKAEEKLLAKAYSDISKSGLGAYAASKGISENVIAGLYMQESKAGTALKSHTGALGPWQTTTGYRKDNNISLADNNDFLKVGKIVVDNIAKELKETGSLRQAVLSHNAGSSGANQFMKNGRVSGSDVRNNEVAGYLPKIDKWASWGGKSAGLLSSSNSGKDFQDFQAAQMKQMEEANRLRDELADTDTQRLNAHNRRIAEITKNFQGKEQEKYLKQEDQQYEASKGLAKLQFEFQVNGWKWVGEQRIKNQAIIDKAAIDATKGMTEQQKAIQKAGIDERAKYDIEQFQKTQQLKLQELSLNVTRAGDQARLSMLERNSPQVFATSQLDSSRISAQAALNKDYQNERSAIFDQNLDPTEQNARLLQAQQEYLESRQALNEMYSQKEVELSKTQQQTQLQLWSNLVSGAQTTFSQITQSIMNANDKQSSSYQVAFAAQQAFAIASAIISAQLAASQVAADATITVFGAKIAASQAMLAMGYANAGLIAAQTIAGFADGGYTGSGGKYDPAGIVHKGEVVFSQADIARLGGVNKVEAIRQGSNGYADGGLVGAKTISRSAELSGYIANSNSSGDVQVNITINQDGSNSTDVKGDDQKGMANVLANGFRKIIVQECRQGGIIYNYMKGR